MTDNKKSQSNQKPRRFSYRRGFSIVGNIQHSSTARFGAALKERRMGIGLTQSDLADLTGLNRSYISEVESGKESISLDRAEKLAKAVGCSLAELLS